MFTPGIPQLAIFALIVLVLFGKRLPGVMRSVGASVGELKKGLHESGLTDDDPAPAAPAAAPPAAVETKTPTAV